MTTAKHTYGADPAQFAELSLPERPPRGVAVLVHGGFWKPAYDLSHLRPLVPGLVAAGWAVWLIEYRRGTGAADTLDDVSAALAACPVEAGPRVAIGHSAGGHLATWAGSQDIGLTQVVSLAGVLDLVSAHEAGLGDGAVARFLGHPPGAADAAVDPIRIVPAAIPVWCLHATGDTNVPITQSRAYVGAARAAGGVAELVEVTGDHFTVVDPASRAWELVKTHLASLVPGEAAG